MSTKTKPDGGALNLILEKWIFSIQTQIIQEDQISVEDTQMIPRVETKIYETINELSDMIYGFDFAKVISLYWKASKTGDDDQKARAIKWLRGEYTTKSEARKELGVNAIVSDDNWYEYVKLFSMFLVKAGYKGMLILIDELVNIFKIPHSITRQYNYEKILAMYNDTLQGKAKYIGIIMGGTPQCIEDTRKGIFSYEALKSRLEDGRFVSDDMRDLLAPIIKLKPLNNEELFVLIEKLSEIHANLYGYTAIITDEDLVAFLKIEYERVGADTNITPREIIRDFIELLNIMSQNPEKKITEMLGSGAFEFAKNQISDEAIHAGFAEFEL